MKRYPEDKVPIKEVAKLLENGAIMLYPTDTLPGIGCLGGNQKALDKLFSIKKRGSAKPVSYAFSSFQMMAKYVELSPFVGKFQSLLPGKLTLVLPKKNDGAILHGVKSLNLGCRIPQVPWLLDLIKYLDAPIVTTSANISGTDPVKLVSDIPSAILNQIDILIEWKGELLGIGSTVIDLSIDNTYTVLREGAVSEGEIKSAILN